MASQYSVVDNSWELIDPNPDIHQLFSQFNQTFFWGKLSSVYVQWSPRMTLCAGVCKYHKRNRECSIHLSKPLLSYRPRKDLVETLLHEMIHAYLFIADNDRERESHGPKFHEHMYRINKLTGANITVYHTFHDEVSHFKTHWWKCNGPCQHRHPFYGTVKRSMNRAPGPNDFWFKDHQKNCGGTFIKIKEPSPKKAVKRKKEATDSQKPQGGIENMNKITNYFKSPTKSNISSPAATTIGSSQPSTAMESCTNADPFSGRGFVLGSIGNNTRTGKSSDQSLSRNLFGTSNSSTLSLTSGNLKTSGTGAQSQSLPPRRGEHPLLAKWLQNHKDASSSLNRLASKKSETFTRLPNHASSIGSGIPSNFLTGLGYPSAETNKKPKIEVIDLD